jgi:HK97 family phage prohead protease
MDIERKFIDLKDLTVTEEGPGHITGYRSVFGEIDEGGDLVAKGFFADAIPEYLSAGFTAHSHDWDFDKVVGYPIDAKEDDYGLFVDSEFHSTPDAQNVRTKAIERKKAGKRVGFSFGFSISDKSYIEAKDYKDQLALYVRPDRLQANLLKAQKFDRIRILKKGEIMEDSIVTAPMNKLAMASGVKSEDQIKELSEDQIQQVLTSANDEFFLKVIAASESFESFDKAAPAALKKFIENMQRNHEARVKEGRVLSSSNRATVQKCKDALTALMGDLDALLQMSEPKPKEKEIDVSALRTQSMRLRSSALRTLSRTLGQGA